ncbi:Pentatricopeptide repeat-containing protein 2, mitochondrial [Larimichthys crocea]|uniref:Pentatricopeptide repeat-containing protein 2, mitochondrial n=1 Tax=Larimichthys crocea TaxID=215358 RepID=A0A6G0I1R2_LARCR|nr:Pentatricopeptide repeat-containing protein 2, mitochondrial [Larimichthys crocea]
MSGTICPFNTATLVDPNSDELSGKGSYWHPGEDSVSKTPMNLSIYKRLRQEVKRYRGGYIFKLLAKRHLLSEDVIKLQNFQQKKLSVAHLGTGSKGNYIELFSQKLQKNELILRDELKLLLHLCQSADDMVIARDAIYRYHVENRNFIEFRFGPLFMRLCYELGLEDLAVANLQMRMQGFQRRTSFNIAIDMLFTKGSYINALDVLRTMKKQGVPFNKDTMMLAFGTCYKLNTEESYKICTALLEQEQAKGQFISRHAYCFAVALALSRWRSYN